MNRDIEAVLDEYLVLAAQGGSADAFRRLVERWTPMLRRHARRTLLDTEAAVDAVQDAWLAIARGIKRLDDPARFGAWAFAITSRRCVDEIRRRQRQRSLIQAVGQDAAASQIEDPADPALTLDLAAALVRLAPDQRLLVSLFYGEGLSVEEIARAHNVPPGTVKSRLFAIRQTLKSQLERPDHDQR